MPKILSRNDKWVCAALTILSTIVHYRWFVSLGIFTSGDWWFISLTKYRDYLHVSPLWVPDNLGGMSSVPQYYIIRWLEAVVAVTTGAGFGLAEKIFYFIPVAVMSVPGIYLLLRKYSSTVGAAIGSLIFVFSTPLLFDHAGPLTIGVVYALSPWAILTYINLLERPRLKQASIAALVFSACMLYELRITAIILVICFGLTLWRLIFSSRKIEFLKGIFLPLTYFGVLLLILQCFWIVPYLITPKSTEFTDLLGRGLFVSFSSITNALALYHPFWTGQRPATFVVQTISLAAWIIPIFAFGGLVLRRRQRNPEVYYWALVAVIGIFLVKQANPPFTGAYGWLFTHVPGFNVYRESSKFYLLPMLAYAVLVAESVVTLKAKFDESATTASTRISKPAFIVAAGIIALVAVSYAVPIFTGGLRTIMIERKIPSDYVTFNNYVNKQADFFRVMWVPAESRWSENTSLHPKILPPAVSSKTWLTTSENSNSSIETLRDKAIEVMDSENSDLMMQQMSVKYVVVPLRDTANEDDFIRNYGDDTEYYIKKLTDTPYLHRVDIGTKKLAVFENSNYDPYFKSYPAVTSLAASSQIGDFRKFMGSTLGIDTVWVKRDGGKADARPLIMPYQDITSANIAPTEVTTTVSAPPGSSLYYKANNYTYSYGVRGSVLSFYRQSTDSVSVNGKVLLQKGPQPQLVSQEKLDDKYDYYLTQGSQHIEVNGNTQDIQSLGQSSTPFALKSVDQSNLLSNPSFENGAWETQVSDCNMYDATGNISMSVNKSGGNHYLTLEAAKHTACTTSAAFPVSSGDLLVKLKFRIKNTQAGGMRIIFNDPGKTTIQRELKPQTKDWNGYEEFMSVPAGATSARVELRGYPEYTLSDRASTDYDDIRISQASSTPLTQTDPASFASVAVDTPVQITAQRDAGQDPGNLIADPSFETGLWQEAVGDCNAYNNEPRLKMSLDSNQKTDGSKSLRLEAQTHVACTSQSNIPVSQNENYYLSFDYQSPNSKVASYYLVFDDPRHTRKQDELRITDTKWHTYSTQIKAPLGAKHVALVFYANAREGENIYIVNRYDNTKLLSIPELNSYFIGQKQPISSQTSKTGEVVLTSQTAEKKEIKLKGVSGKVYLAMSESYHPGWVLHPTSSTKPAVQHLKLNEWQNGWVIDVNTLCNSHNACTKNADGTHDIKMIAEFSPQRAFYLGLWVSGLAGAMIFVGLGYTATRSFLHRRDQRRNGGRPTPPPSPTEVAQRVAKKTRRVVRL